MLIDDAQKIAGHRLKEPNTPPRALDDANLRDALAWSAPIPEGFKEREITPIQHEWNEDKKRRRPFFADLAEMREARIEKVDRDDEENDNGEPDQIIDQQGDEAAADASDRHVDRHQFGGFDAKLIPLRLISKPIRHAQ